MGECAPLANPSDALTGTKADGETSQLDAIAAISQAERRAE
jgi:hypothetical protein